MCFTLEAYANGELVWYNQSADISRLAKDIMINDIEELTADLKYRFGADKIKYELWRNNCDDEEPIEEFEM